MLYTLVGEATPAVDADMFGAGDVLEVAPGGSKDALSPLSGVAMAGGTVPEGEGESNGMGCIWKRFSISSSSDADCPALPLSAIVAGQVLSLCRWREKQG